MGLQVEDRFPLRGSDDITVTGAQARVAGRREHPTHRGVGPPVPIRSGDYTIVPVLVIADGGSPARIRSAAVRISAASAPTMRARRVS